MAMTKRWAATAAGVGLLAALLTGCGGGGSGGGPTKPVPQELRDLDLAAGGHAAAAGQYTTAFTLLAGRCQEQGVGLGNEVGAVLKLLKEHGVRDETRLTVMQHLAEAIPAGTKQNCADVGGSYVTLRSAG